MSEALMIMLANKGMDRQEAHELVRTLAISSASEGVRFKEILLKDSKVTSRLTEDEIDTALNPTNYLGTNVQQVERCIEKARSERRLRGIR